MLRLIAGDLLVGEVDLLEQRLEPETDVRAREPDRAAEDRDSVMEEDKSIDVSAWCRFWL